MHPHSGVTIRAITAGELDALLPLVAGYQRFYEAEPNEDRNREFFARFIAPSDRGLLLGAFVEDRLTGFACLYWAHSSVRAEETALMNDLFVEPGHRGSGIGRALIDGAAAAARERGAKRLEWQTAPSNAGARRLYDRTGASPSTWVTYELPLSD